MSIFIVKNENEIEKQQTFMLQLRVVRAFKSTLEDLEDKRSIHSLRSLRNFQNQSAGFFYKRGNQHSGQQSSNLDNLSIPVPKSPINLNDFNALKYMDDDSQPDDRSNTNGQSHETRI
jgi:hypothetical protein